MKNLLFLLFAVLSNVLCDLSEERNSNFLFHKFDENTYKERLQQSEFARGIFSRIHHKCPGTSAKLMDAFGSMATCISEIDDSITVCAGIRTHMPNCTSSIVSALQDCMPESAKNVPRLAMASTLSAFSHTCSLNGEQIFELTNDCIRPDESNAAEFAKCRDLAKEKFEDIQKAPSAAKICGLGNELKPCFQSYLNASCPNEITRSTWSGMFDAFFAPCAGPTGRAAPGASQFSMPFRVGMWGK